MLLFELSFSTFGKPYSCENFTPVKEFFLQELRTIGLVYMKTVSKATLSLMNQYILKLFDFIEERKTLLSNSICNTTCKWS